MSDAPASEPGLAVMSFVDPQLGTGGWRYREVPPATTGQPVRRGGPTTGGPLRATVAGAGTMLDLAEVHEFTATTALLVAVRGVLVHEWYADGVEATSALLGASAGKGLLAHLVATEVQAKNLDLAAPVTRYVPELAGSGYDQVAVHHLLTMTSGVNWVEDHRDADGAATALIATFSAGGSSRERLLRIGPGAPPGSRFAYCTADSQVLDWVRERAGGHDFVGALARLWSQVGAEATAYVALDGDGVALAGGGTAACARDWLRIGLLQLDGRSPNGSQVLDESWIEAASVAAQPFTRPGRLPSELSTHVGFGRHWWPLDDAGRRVCADGSRGQFVYVDRDASVVVVKTSQWAYTDPWHDRQCRDLSYLALPEIATAARAQATPPGGARR